MPYLQIQSDLDLSAEQRQSLLTKARELVATELGKSSAFCMVSFSSQSEILFGDTSEPSAFASLKSLGIDREQASALTKTLGSLLKSECDLSPKRFYLCCENIPRGLWGWNDKVF